MTKEKAIEAMDRLTEAGYSVSLHAHAIGGGYVGPDIHDGVRYSIAITEIGVDKVDVKALVVIADELDLDLGLSPVRGMANLTLGEPDRRPEVVKTQRRHPK